MKNNKGFTLAELMAVIVIISILLGAATTAVVYQMSSSTKKADKLGAKNYITAVNDYNYMADPADRLDCSIPCNVNDVTSTIKDALSGRHPRGGTITISSTTHKVTSARIDMKKFTVIYDGNKYTIAE